MGGRMRLRSRAPIGMRTRIAMVSLTAMALVLLLTASALLILHHRLLTDSLDETLASRSEEVVALLEAGRLPAIITGQGDIDSVTQVVDDSGSVVATTANFIDQPALADPGPGPGTYRTTRLPTDESRMRVHSRRFGDHVVHTAAPIDDVEESVAALRLGLLVTIPMAMILLGVVLWRTVGRALRPVERIRNRVGEITATNLHLRVPQPPTRDEIGRLAATMNDMLERLERSADRQRRFVADASHELRGPLTRIRTELEVDLLQPAAADLTATHRSVLEEAEGLQRLIDDLLALARLDAAAADPGLATDRRPVDLDDIVLGEVEAVRAIGRVTVDISRVSAVQVLGNRDQLARAVRNLADNAARHASSTITFQLTDLGDTALLSIADDGPGIEAADRERIFERFTRLDEARATDDGGTGLGLAITREIIERHGGSVVVDPDVETGTRFVVRLPAVRP